MSEIVQSKYKGNNITEVFKHAVLVPSYTFVDIGSSVGEILSLSTFAPEYTYVGNLVNLVENAKG